MYSGAEKEIMDFLFRNSSSIQFYIDKYEERQKRRSAALSQQKRDPL
jgi:hypothetical protein